MTEIEIAAMHWQKIKECRLEAGRHKRLLSGVEGLGAYLRQYDADKHLTELRRQERAALRTLAKACMKQRNHLNKSDDAVLDVEMLLLN